MTQPPKSHPVLTALGLMLLAAACVGAVELSVARYEDPELYETVTAPARDAYEDVHERVDTYIEQKEAELAAERENRARRELAAQLEREQAQQQEWQRAALELAEAERAAQLASAPIIREELLRADPTITELIVEGKREILTGGNLTLTYYNQGDEAWASQPFGRDRIGGYGCGPTALAMAVASTADPTATPANVAAWAAGAGYCVPGGGSSLAIVRGVAAHYGLEYTPLGELDADTLYATLSQGGVIVALMGPGHFTGKGHFILLHGVTLSGGILVADPNSRDNSLTVWEPQTIVDELSVSRYEGSPLWLLTEPLAL